MLPARELDDAPVGGIDQANQLDDLAHVARMRVVTGIHRDDFAHRQVGLYPGLLEHDPHPAHQVMLAASRIVAVLVQVVDGVDHDLLALRRSARLDLRRLGHFLPMMPASWRARSLLLSSPIWRPAIRPSRSMKNDSGGAKTPYAWATSPVTSMAAGQGARMRAMKSRAASDRSW